MSAPPNGAHRRCALFLAALLLLAVAAPASAGSATRVQAPAVAAASGAAEATHVARVARYWTPARMRKARPLDGHGTAPADLFDPPMPVASASYATVLDATVAPYPVNGRIFFRRAGRANSCSGTVIDTPTRQLVLTAGHCVNSGPVDGTRFSFWSNFIQFVPAYSEGQAPFGAFVMRRGRAYALSPWVRRANPSFDVGAFLVHPNAAAQNVADAVGGGVSIALNVSRRQQFQTFGYPGRVETLQQCDSPYVGSDRNTFRIPGKPTMSIRCRWGPGASGGGWLIGEATAINGLTSYGIRRDRVHTFGPYFAKGNVGKLVAGL